MTRFTENSPVKLMKKTSDVTNKLNGEVQSIKTISLCWNRHVLFNFKLRSSTPTLINFLREHPSWNIRAQTVLNDQKLLWFMSHDAAQRLLCVAYLLRQDSLPSWCSILQRIQSPSTHSKQHCTMFLPKSGNYASISGSLFFACSNSATNSEFFFLG